MNDNLLMFMHAGSGNHGCEAIVNSLCHIINAKASKEITLISYRAEEDRRYTLGDLCNIEAERSFSKHKIMHILYYIYRAITKDRESFIRYRYHGLIDRKKYPLAISIGGDNYCYDNMLSDLELVNSAFNKGGVNTVLVGCSIEPELLSNNAILNDLKKYKMILARESITYDALKDAGFKNVKLIPDSAFVLNTKSVSLPNGFKEGKTIGINLSPMVQENETRDKITYKNYVNLIKHILDETEYNVALIPHVIWNGNDDRKSCYELYEYFDSLGYKDRVVEIQDCSCEELKGYISNCKYFIGARTHSTIAAYSSCIPTLVVGYSVKAKGIAKDLFPEYDLDNLVVPVQKLEDEYELTNRFKWLLEHGDQLKEYLNNVIPSYKERVYEVAAVLDNIS